MYKKIPTNRKLLVFFIFLAVVYVAYCCLRNKEEKEYFVIKVRDGNNGEVLLDQQDFASVINGLKPKSVQGTFTSDDLSELVRELKGLWIAQISAQYKRRCPGNSTTRECRDMTTVLDLIHETNQVMYNGNKITSKEEWLSSIIDAAFMMFPQAKPKTYETTDLKLVRKVVKKDPVAALKA